MSRIGCDVFLDRFTLMLVALNFAPFNNDVLPISEETVELLQHSLIALSVVVGDVCGCQYILSVFSKTVEQHGNLLDFRLQD